MEPDPIDALDSPPEVKARLRAIRDRIAREEPEALIDEAEERALARGPARRGPRPIPVAPAEPAEPCGVAGCARTVRAAGLCVGHYERRALGRDPTEARCRRCRATFAAPELPAPRSCPACRRPARNFGPMPFGLDPARPAEAEVARRIFRYLIRWPMGRTLEMLAAEGATTRGERGHGGGGHQHGERHAATLAPGARWRKGAYRGGAAPVAPC